MSLIEIKLEKPALKRTEIVEDPEARTRIDIEDEGESDEESLEVVDEGGRGASKGRVLLAVMTFVGTVLAARRLRAWRSGEEESAAIEFGREEERTST